MKPKKKQSDGDGLESRSGLDLVFVNKSVETGLK